MTKHKIYWPPKPMDAEPFSRTPAPAVLGPPIVLHSKFGFHLRPQKKRVVSGLEIRVCDRLTKGGQPHLFLFCVPPIERGREIRQYDRTRVAQGRASVRGASVELLRVVIVVVVVPLLLFVVEFATCVASCPGSVDDEAPAAVKQKAGPTPVGCVARRRPDALLVHALCLHSAGGEQLDVVPFFSPFFYAHASSWSTRGREPPSGSPSSSAKTFRNLLHASRTSQGQSH